MSRADKTRPYRVKIFDTHTALEVHDHRLGECDLQSPSEWLRALEFEDGHEERRCSWDLRSSQMHKASDGCQLCTQSRYFRMKTRTERHQSHKETRSYSREYRNPSNAVDEE